MFIGTTISLFCCYSQANNSRCLKCTPYCVYYIISYTWYNVQNISTYFELFLDILNFKFILVFYSVTGNKTLFVGSKSLRL